MRKIIIGILISICIMFIVLPLASNKSVNVNIDGNFDEWSYMPKTSYEKEDKSKINIKTIKYYLDDNYLYLYIERYYKNKEWDIAVNVIDEKKLSNIEYNVKKTFRLKENNENGKIEAYDTVDDKEIKDIISLFNNNKLEVKIPLESLTTNSKIIYLDIFLIQNDKINVINNKREYLGITNGSTFGGIKNIVGIIMFLKFISFFRKSKY